MGQRFWDGLEGLLWGLFLGGFVGLGVCIWFIDDPLFFPGDTIVIGAGIFAVLGFVVGEPFLDWVKGIWEQYYGDGRF